MPKLQSTGQKRKKIVRIISFILFLIITFVGGQIAGRFKTAIYEWVDNHQETTALVTDLSTEEEEYRNLKGRKRSDTIYLISYKFELNGSGYENQVEAGYSEFSNLQKGSSVAIWFNPEDPDQNDTKDNLESALASNSVTGNMITVAPYTAPASLFLYYLLSLIFVRESKKSLTPGFYSENSWLDIDDRYLVYLVDGELVFFGFDKGKSAVTQEAYQNGSSLDQLIEVSKAKDVKRIPLAEITELVSNHNSDTIKIEHNNTDHNVEFLNQAIKAHALERIVKNLSGKLKFKLRQRSRIEAATPAMIFLIVIFLIAYVTKIFLLYILFGLIALVWVIPTIFSRLMSPTETKSWTLEDQKAAS
jgi:hypothetical protein